jgi:hypothetical protein
VQTKGILAFIHTQVNVAFQRCVVRFLRLLLREQLPGDFHSNSLKLGDQRQSPFFRKTQGRPRQVEV